MYCLDLFKTTCDTLKNGCIWIKNKTLTFTSDAFNTAGIFFCASGGFLYPFADFMDEQLDVDYYGSIGGKGTLDISFYFRTFNKYFNESVPISAHYNGKGEYNESLMNLITKPDNIRTACLLLISTGTLLRVISANIHKHQVYKKNCLYYTNISSSKLVKPSLLEYGYTNLRSVTSSLSTVCFFSTGASLLINSPWMPDDFNFKPYPFQKDFPFNFDVSENTTINLFLGFKLPLTVNLDTNGTADATGGGDIEVDTPKETVPPLPLKETLIGISGPGAYAIHLFFKNQEKNLKNDRRRLCDTTLLPN